MNTVEQVKEICKALDDKKAIHLSVIDISEVSVMADYFVVASGDNINQINAMQHAVDEIMYKNNIHARQVEGSSGSTWILMDYQDVIVHIFSEEDRLFYDLERIWKDGKSIDWESL